MFVGESYTWSPSTNGSSETVNQALRGPWEEEEGGEKEGGDTGDMGGEGGILSPTWRKSCSSTVRKKTVSPSRKRRRKYLALSITTRTARARIRLRRRDSFSPPPPLKDGNSGTTTHTPEKRQSTLFSRSLFLQKEVFRPSLSSPHAKNATTNRPGGRQMSWRDIGEPAHATVRG